MSGIDIEREKTFISLSIPFSAIFLWVPIIGRIFNWW
jgi:hypothetical protein